MAEMTSSVGRRKEAVARVWLKEGKGNIRVNRRGVDEYFSRLVLKTLIHQPFEVTQMEGKFDIRADIKGGGIMGQANALSHGIARALAKRDETLRPPLKKAGLLRRDPRMKERKKYGQKGARKRFQFSKR